MNNHMFFTALIIITLSCLGKSSVFTEKHYFERYLFSSPTDSSFVAYQMDYVIGNRTENTRRVYSLMCNGKDAWPVKGYLDLRKTDKSIEQKNYDGKYALYLSADTDSLLRWSDPFQRIVHEYLGPTVFRLNGQLHPAHMFAMYYYLCTNRTSFVPTPFYQVRDDQMELLYSKNPGVHELNIPWGMEVSNIEQDFSLENWSYEFNPIESVIRINESQVPKHVRKEMDKQLRVKIYKIKHGYLEQ